MPTYPVCREIVPGPHHVFVVPEADARLDRDRTSAPTLVSLLSDSTPRVVASATLEDDLRHGQLWAAWWSWRAEDRQRTARRLRDLADYLESRGTALPQPL